MWPTLSPDGGQGTGTRRRKGEAEEEGFRPASVSPRTRWPPASSPTKQRKPSWGAVTGAPWALPMPSRGETLWPAHGPPVPKPRAPWPRAPDPARHTPRLLPCNQSYPQEGRTSPSSICPHPTPTHPKKAPVNLRTSGAPRSNKGLPPPGPPRGHVSPGQASSVGSSSHPQDSAPLLPAERAPGLPRLPVMTPMLAGLRKQILPSALLETSGRPLYFFSFLFFFLQSSAKQCLCTHQEILKHS